MVSPELHLLSYKNRNRKTMVTSRNPYVGGNEGSPKLQQSVVAFVDILGYKDIVEENKNSGTSNELLKKLHNTLQTSRKYVDPDQGDKKYMMDDLSAMRAFTDNIVIGYPIRGRGDAESELVMIFNNLSYFQMIMTMNGFFVRGAIAVGELYMDDIAVFGVGFIEACEAEKSLARDPRIILTNSAKKAVEKHLKYYGAPSYSPQASYLLKDCDGQYFVNYLDTIINEPWLVLKKELLLHKKELLLHKSAIETNLKKYLSKPYVWSKYMWTANYHNYFCKELLRLDNSYLINLAEIKVHPALIVDTGERLK